MTIDKLKEYMNNGNDVEFIYHGNQYSITKYIVENKEYVSFCEFYKNPIDAESVDGLLSEKYYGERIKDVWESLEEKDVWIE